MVAPEFDTLAQAGGMPAQDAAPAFTSSLRPDGTLAISGDTGALRAMLAASGIPARSMVPINGGLLIGRSQAGKVQEAIDRMQAPSAMPQDVMANADTAAPGAQTAEQMIAQAPKFDPETAGAEGGGLPPLEQPTAMGAPGAGPDTAQGFASNVPEAPEQQAQADTEAIAPEQLADTAQPTNVQDGNAVELPGPPPEALAMQDPLQGDGTSQPEAMQSAQTGAAPTQPEAMAMAGPVQSTPELARIQRLRDSGENKVADILQRRQTLGAVQTELASMQAATPDLQHHASPAFSQHYQQRRLAGMKPAEASAHAGMLAAVQSAAPQIGMPDTAIKALAAKLPDIPIDEAPGFIERFTLALIKRGIVQPFEGSNQIADMVERARDTAMNGALDSLYGAHGS